MAEGGGGRLRGRKRSAETYRFSDPGVSPAAS